MLPLEQIVNVIFDVRHYEATPSQDAHIDDWSQIVHVNQLVKITWLLCWNALQDAANVTNKIKNFITTYGDEAGISIEVTDPLITELGLANKGGWLIRYTPAERRQIIDELMADFNTVFGYYPKSVGGPYIDAYTLSYIEANYPSVVIASAFCPEQNGIDWLYNSGGIQFPYYPSPLNTLCIANETNKLDIVIIPYISRDMYNGHIGASCLWSTHPDFMKLPGKGTLAQYDTYTSSLLDEFFAQETYNPFGYWNTLIETNTWNVAIGDTNFQTAFDHLMATLIAKRATYPFNDYTMHQLSQAFRAQYSGSPFYKFVFLDPNAGAGTMYITASSCYRAMFHRLSTTNFKMIDYRIMNPNIKSYAYDNGYGAAPASMTESYPCHFSKLIGSNVSGETLGMQWEVWDADGAAWYYREGTGTNIANLDVNVSYTADKLRLEYAHDLKPSVSYVEMHEDYILWRTVYRHTANRTLDAKFSAFPDLAGTGHKLNGGAGTCVINGTDGVDCLITDPPLRNGYYRTHATQPWNSPNSTMVCRDFLENCPKNFDAGGALRSYIYDGNVAGEKPNYVPFQDRLDNVVGGTDYYIEIRIYCKVNASSIEVQYCS